MMAEMIYHLGVHQCAQLGGTVAIALLVIISERSYTSTRGKREGLLVRGKAEGGVGTEQCVRICGHKEGIRGGS